MNEIPFSLNIMSVCVHTASGLVERLAPVNKKTWTVLQQEVETGLRNDIFHVNFARLSDCCYLLYQKCNEYIIVLFFTVSMKIFAFLSMQKL